MGHLGRFLLEKPEALVVLRLWIESFSLRRFPGYPSRTGLSCSWSTFPWKKEADWETQNWETSLFSKRANGWSRGKRACDGSWSSWGVYRLRATLQRESPLLSFEWWREESALLKITKWPVTSAKQNNLQAISIIIKVDTYTDSVYVQSNKDLSLWYVCVICVCACAT
jgi:hypothetical protein